MIFIKMWISYSICGSVGECNNVKELLNALNEQFETLVKSIASTLITTFSTMKLIAVKGVWEHMMRIRDIMTQLKKLEIDISKSFLVHY